MTVVVVAAADMTVVVVAAAAAAAAADMTVVAVAAAAAAAAVVADIAVFAVARRPLGCRTLQLPPSSDLPVSVVGLALAVAAVVALRSKSFASKPWKVSVKYWQEAPTVTGPLLGLHSTFYHYLGRTTVTTQEANLLDLSLE